MGPWTLPCVSISLVVSSQHLLANVRTFQEFHNQGSWSLAQVTLYPNTVRRRSSSYW